MLSVGIKYFLKHCLCLSIIKWYLISKFLLTVFEVWPIPSLMYWQQAKVLPLFFTPEFELPDEKELLHNILPKFGACRLQLMSSIFFNAFLI